MEEQPRGLSAQNVKFTEKCPDSQAFRAKCSPIRGELLLGRWEIAAIDLLGISDFALLIAKDSQERSHFAIDARCFPQSDAGPWHSSG
jgi:hypothetical protein